MYPLCLSETHAVKVCFQLKDTTRRCRKCHYTHARDVGCRPVDSILQANRSPLRGRANVKVTPGNVPSRESHVARRTSSEQGKRLKVIPKDVPPRGMGNKNAQEAPKKANQETGKPSRQCDALQKALFAEGLPTSTVAWVENAASVHSTGTKSREEWAEDIPVCVLCVDVGKDDYDTHEVANFPEWENQNIPTHLIWSCMSRHNVCFSCLREDHEPRACPKPAPQCSACRMNHEKRMPCKLEVLRASSKLKEVSLETRKPPRKLK